MRQRQATKLTIADYIIIALLICLTVAYAARYVSFSQHPFEDAAILMRYSKHLAEGHGIVWNIGEQPVDGATDFLFMAAVAGLHRVGLPLELAVRALAASAHLLTVIIVYIAIVRIHGANRWLALMSAAYLAVGPGIAYISAYFGTPFFALFVTITWCLAYWLRETEQSHLLAFMFALSALLMGLIRPEGVFLAMFMFLAVVYSRGVGNSKTIGLNIAAAFILIGGLYFVWRWNYFGYPLPNPFYKKGGGHLYLSSLRVSLDNAVLMCAPFLAIYLLAAIRSKAAVKEAVFSLIPIGGFVGLWVLLSNEMNFAMRFQYPILPVLLISWPAVVGGFAGPAKWSASRYGRGAVVALRVGVVLVILFYGHNSFSHSVGAGRDGRYDVAVMLSKYSSKDYTMAVSEAGLLPLYSNWRAVDTWGLNDQWIAHSGGITEAYLDRYKPELIIFWANFSPLVPPAGGGDFLAMSMTLKSYAEKHRYTLAAAFGIKPDRTHYYYVRPDFPDSAKIVQSIRDADYCWYRDGRACNNYAISH